MRGICSCIEVGQSSVGVNGEGVSDVSGLISPPIEPFVSRFIGNTVTVVPSRVLVGTSQEVHVQHVPRLDDEKCPFLIHNFGY